MITDIAHAVVWLAFAFVAYVSLTRYIATLPTSAQLRDRLAQLEAEHSRAKLALENLANATKAELEQLRMRQTQQAAQATISKTRGPFG